MNKQTKHTPAPWIINGSAIEANPVGALATCIAHVYNESDEHAANARLLAAAPELLEACKRAQTAFAFDQGGKARRETMAQLKAAIAKAEGKESK